MKKVATIAIVFLTALAANTQSVYKLQDGKEISRELIDIPASILVAFLLAIFLLNIIKWLFNYRLKSKMIDKGVSNDIIKEYLQPEHNEARQQTIKWFIILVGTGIGLTMVSLTLPLGIHSLAIMAFSLAFGYLAYYFYIRHSEK